MHETQLRKLEDDKNLRDENVLESDELLLIEVRPFVKKENLPDENLKGPTENEIMMVTKDIPISNSPKPITNADCQADFHTEIRQILVTLVQASAKILTHSPDAAKFYVIVKEKLENQLKPPNLDSKALKYLVDMGFSEKMSIRALRLRKMNTSEALEWLLDHQDDINNEDIQLPTLDLLTNEEAGPSTADNQATKQPNLIHLINLLLESYKQLQKMSFKADQKLIESLEEMGFERRKILETLRLTGNNQANACAWLIGERRPSLQNLYDGMEPNSPIYNAIMANPHIQLSLTKPKMLLAYLSMLETPLSTSVWMKGPQVSEFLSIIFKTYNSEKHTIMVNR